MVRDREQEKVYNRQEEKGEGNFNNSRMQAQELKEN
jgi:hypothetical protein